MTKLIAPLLKWPGGKYRKAKVLRSILPDHEVYVEPFVGGGSVFLNKEPAPVEVLGDGNEDLIRFYERARRGSLRACKSVPNTRESWEKVTRCTSDCCKLMRNKMSFHGSEKFMETSNPDGRPIGTVALGRLGEYEKRLRHAHLRIADFEDTMNRWDSPETVHYLDPPWITLSESAAYSKKHYADATLSLERVAKTAARMKGKVIISYDDSPEARRIFNKAGLRVYLLNTDHSPGGRGVQRRKELVVTNFKLPPKVKVR